jgi:hypothetical protein
MGKLAIVVGVAAGYVLGARAGRERYEQIKQLTGRAWNHPAVVEQRHKTTTQIKQRGPEVAAAAGQAAIKGMGQAAKSAATAGFQAAVGRRSGPVVPGSHEQSGASTAAPPEAHSAPSQRVDATR